MMKCDVQQELSSKAHFKQTTVQKYSLFTVTGYTVHVTIPALSDFEIEENVSS